MSALRFWGKCAGAPLLALLAGCSPHLLSPRSSLEVEVSDSEWTRWGSGEWRRADLAEGSGPGSADDLTAHGADGRAVHEAFLGVTLREALRRLAPYSMLRVYVSREVEPQLVRAGYWGVGWREVLDDVLRKARCLGHETTGDTILVEPGRPDEDRYGMEWDPVMPEYSWPDRDPGADHDPGVARDGVDTSDRERTCAPSGTWIETYPGSQRERTYVEDVLKSLGRDPRFAKLLERLLIVVSPPGKGLEAIPEVSRECISALGVAWRRGGAVPTIAVRSDSIRRPNVVVSHEILHVFARSLGSGDRRDIFKVWEGFSGNSQAPGESPAHLFVYMGAYYLAGFGEVIWEVAPEVGALCERLLGDVRVPSRGMTAATARSMIREVAARFRR